MVERSRKIKERLFECLKNGEVTFGDEIEIIEHLVNRMNPITQSEYAKRNSISRAGAKKRIMSGKEAYLDISGHKFIIP